MPSSTILLTEYNTDEQGLSDLIHSVFDDDDFFHSVFGDDYSCNHYAINIDTIHEEVDGIYKAINLYEDSETYGEFGEAKDMTRPHFYARLAFVSLHDIVREEVERRMELNAEHAHQECSE